MPPTMPLALEPLRVAPSRFAAPPLIPRVSVRRATLIPRPRRPYSFTQLVQLSDGSTYTMRTTSPAAIYRATKDTRNNLLWQPSEKALRNVELDEAGKLAAFRERFGSGYDGGDAEAEAGFANLITGYATEDVALNDSGPKKTATKRK